MIESWGFYILTPEQYVHSEKDLTAESQTDTFRGWNDILSQAEKWGFDGLSFAEHHFMPDSVLASPHIYIASLIPQTEKLRFTTAGSVLSLHNGWRYGAEIAMLRYMSEGRFEPGVAPGSGPTEAVLTGIPAEDARPRYESGVEMLRKTLTGERVSQHDKFYDVDDLPLVPRWIPSEGADSVWATVMSPESAAVTAQRGWKLMTGWLPTNIAALVANSYREAADAAGFEIDPTYLGIRRRVFVAETDAEAQEKFEEAESLMPVLMGLDSGQMEVADPKIRKMIANPDDFAIGSPETVAEKLISQCEEAGYGSLFAWADFASFSWEDHAKSHELFGTKVIPQLRKADVGTGTGVSEEAKAENEAFVANRRHTEEEFAEKAR